MVGIQVIAAILTGIGVLAVIKEEDYIMNLSVILIEIVIMLIGFTVLVFLFLFAWMLHLAGVKTFWQGVGLNLIYMLCVFAWDTFFLDWVLFAVLAGFISSGLMLWIW